MFGGFAVQIRRWNVDYAPNLPKNPPKTPPRSLRLPETGCNVLELNAIQNHRPRGTFRGGVRPPETSLNVRHLIPLKAIAWLELTARKEQGTKVDAKDVRKHLNDVLRLSQLLAPATRIAIDRKIGDDMTRFLVAIAADTSIDPKVLQLGNVSVAELVARIAQAYEIELPAQAAG